MREAAERRTRAMQERYEVDNESLLGQGSFGVVKPGVDKRNCQNIAVEIVKGIFDEVVQEAILLCGLAHPNIVCIRDAFTTMG